MMIVSRKKNKNLLFQFSHIETPNQYHFFIYHLRVPEAAGAALTCSEMEIVMSFTSRGITVSAPPAVFSPDPLHPFNFPVGPLGGI